MELKKRYLFMLYAVLFIWNLLLLNQILLKMRVCVTTIEDNDEKNFEYGKKNSENVKSSAFTVNALDDFLKYPCLPDGRLSSIFNKECSCVRSIRRQSTTVLKKESEACFKAKLRVFDKKIPMCTYNPNTDIISRFLHKKSGWEPQLVRNMIQTLRENDNMMLLDIGCNIGVYSLAAASYGFPVICVDANYENLEMIQRTMYMANIIENITLIWNAVSDGCKTLQLKVIKNNIGGSRFGEVLRHQRTSGKQITVNAVTLDELQNLMKGRKVFVKIDIERHELMAFKGATQFFDGVDVRIIQMELDNTGHKLAVVDLLNGFGFEPFKDHRGHTKLSTDNASSWPGDVYFIKKKYKN